MSGTILYVVLFATLTVLTLRKPHVALVAVLCMFGMEQLGQVYIPFLRANGQFTNFLVVALVLLAILLAYFRGNIGTSFSFGHSKVRFLSIALYAFALVSLLWTPVDGWIYWAATWPYLVLYIVLAPLLISKVSDLEDVQSTFIWIGGVLITFLAFVPEWGSRYLLQEDTGEAIRLPLSLAQVSGYLLITAAIHLKKNYLSIGWLILVVVSALVAAIKTGSRGQVIFSIVSLLLVMPILWQRFTLRHAIQLAATAATIVAAGLYILEATEASSGRWTASTMLGDLESRYAMAQMLLSEWINSPLTVLFGLGNSASFSPDIIGSYSHIVPLEILGEEGVIGLAMFCTIVILTVRQALRFKRLDFLQSDVKRVYAATFGCFLFTLLLSFK